MMKFVSLAIVFAVFALAANGQAMQPQMQAGQCADCDRFTGLMGGLAQHAFPGQGDNRQVDAQLCARLPADQQAACESAIQTWGMDGVQTLISANPAKLCPHVASCYPQGSLSQQQIPQYQAGQQVPQMPAGFDPAAAQALLSLDSEEGDEAEDKENDHDDDNDDDNDDDDDDESNDDEDDNDDDSDDEHDLSKAAFLAAAARIRRGAANGDQDDLEAIKNMGNVINLMSAVNSPLLDVGQNEAFESAMENTPSECGSKNCFDNESGGPPVDPTELSQTAMMLPLLNTGGTVEAMMAVGGM